MRTRWASRLAFAGFLALSACVVVRPGAGRIEAERNAAIEAAHAAALGCAGECRPKPCSPPTAPGCHEDSVPCDCWPLYQAPGKRPANVLLNEIIDMAAKWSADPACSADCRECWRQVGRAAVDCSMGEINHVTTLPHTCRNCSALYYDVERAWQHAHHKDGYKGALCELRHSTYGD